MQDDEEPIRLLFICTGNICRSPMAEGIALTYGRSTGRWIETKSASTLGLIDRPAEPNAVAVCAEIDVDISAHRSQPITDELLDWADHVLVMTYQHAEHIRQHHKDVGEKLVMVGAIHGVGDIPDPMGGWKFRFRKVRRLLEAAMTSFVDQLPEPP